MSKQVQEVYNQIAEQFAQSRQKLYWPEIELFVTKIKEKSGQQKVRILDLGCGSGRLLNYLSDIKTEYTGVDLSENLLQEARKNYPHYRFLVGQMQELSNFKNESFDYVFLLASFHHLKTKAERLKTLLEIKRVLKKDGLILMTNWNLWQKKYRKYIWQDFWFKLFLKEKSFKDTIIPFGVEKVPRYYHVFSLRELNDLYQKAGLKLQERFYFNQKKERCGFWKGRNIGEILGK